MKWLGDLVRVGGALVGIVLTAIGGVMFSNTLLKYYVFGFDTGRHFQAEEMCRTGKSVNEFGMRDIHIEKPETPEQMNDEEVAECIERKTEIEKARYARNEKEEMIDGFAFLIVGAFLWWVHRRKKQ